MGEMKKKRARGRHARGEGAPSPATQAIVVIITFHLCKVLFKNPRWFRLPQSHPSFHGGSVQNKNGGQRTKLTSFHGGSAETNRRRRLVYSH